MRTIAFIGQKGGTGKTTLAASIGVAAQQAGERVFLVDMDPQGSLTAWSDRRTAETPAADRSMPDKLPSAISSLAKAGYSLMIVDTMGSDTAATAFAMRVADLALIPARPSILDIEASRPTVSALSRLGRQFAFVLNQCPTGRTGRPLDASRALGLLGALGQPNTMQRADHLDAIALGLGVTEYAPNGKAAEEIRLIWSWIRKKIDG